LQGQNADDDCGEEGGHELRHSREVCGGTRTQGNGSTRRAAHDPQKAATESVVADIGLRLAKTSQRPSDAQHRFLANQGKLATIS